MEKQPDTLCWGCKRALNSDEYNCSWSSHGVPVDGWEAEDGKTFELPDPQGGRCRTEKSYCVHSCPLFVQDQEFNTVADFTLRLREMYGCARYLDKRQLVRMLERYEQDTGKQVPAWVLAEWNYTHSRREKDV